MCPTILVVVNIAKALGILADALSGRMGKIMYAGIIIILLLLLFLGDMVFQKDKRLDGTEK